MPWRISHSNSTYPYQIENNSSNNYLGRDVWIYDDNQQDSTFSKEHVVDDNIYRNIQFSQNENINDDHLDKGVNYYITGQTEEGYWSGDYGGPHFLLPGFVIALAMSKKTLPEEHRSGMITHILNIMNDDGGIGICATAESSMFCSVLNYVAMRFLGHPGDKRLLNWINLNGGVLSAPSWAKLWLSVAGILSYDVLDDAPLIPELWLLPYKFNYFHPMRFWCHCRMVYLPMSYLYGLKANLREYNNDFIPIIDAIRNEFNINSKNEGSCHPCCSKDVYSPRSFISKIVGKITCFYEKSRLFSGIRKWLRNRALKYIETVLRHEDISTHYIDIGPVNKALNMACASIYDPDELIKYHYFRVFDYIWVGGEGVKIKGYNGSQLWDTSFAGQALKSYNRVRNKNSSVKKSLDKINKYLLNSKIIENPKNHTAYYRHDSIGAWPFSNRDHGWPIVDCTGEALKGLWNIDISKHQDSYDILLSFHNNWTNSPGSWFSNDYGGWSTYELMRGPSCLEKLNPSETFGDIVVDYSYVELTASAMTGLLEVSKDFNHTKFYMVSGLKYLLNMQRADGSFYGSWGVCFTYGAFWGIRGICAGINFVLSNDEIIIKILKSLELSISFLLSHQLHDGGWGETFDSCRLKEYHSTSSQSLVVQTSWALLSIIQSVLSIKYIHDNTIHLAIYDTFKPNEIRHHIERGVNFIKSVQLTNGDFPVGDGAVSGVFNRSCLILYSNYRNIFPIWALAEYEYFSTQLG